MIPAPDAPACRPIFILSCERSGSTLLRYLLDTHPEIACPGELVLGQLVRSLTRLLDRTMGTAPTAAEYGPAWVRSEVRRVIGGRMDDYANARGKRRWAEKSPGNLEFLDELLWAFPEAQFICLYRRSLDVVQSCLDCSAGGFMPELAAYAARSPENLIAAMLESWAAKTSKMLALERSALCCRVHYEALVNDPAATLDRLFAFLGMAWDRSLLDEVFAAPHDQGGGDYKIRSASRIDSSRIGTGAALNSAKLGAVPQRLQRECTELNLRLGYPIWSSTGIFPEQYPAGGEAYPRFPRPPD